MSLSALETARLERLCLFEQNARSQGFLRIAGVDEAGRGPLAGPVVAAACILPEGLLIEGANDSKQLLPSRRLTIFQRVHALPGVSTGIGVVRAEVIDQINILQATFQAMLLAVAHLREAPDFLLVDGRQMPPTSLPGKAIIRGDALSQSIAVASILAKQTRDALMCEYHQQWPQYNFLNNKGYGTGEHLRALEKYGPCPIHRLSFAPLKSS